LCSEKTFESEEGLDDELGAAIKSHGAGQANRATGDAYTREW